MKEYLKALHKRRYTISAYIAVLSAIAITVVGFRFCNLIQLESRYTLRITALIIFILQIIVPIAGFVFANIYKKRKKSTKSAKLNLVYGTRKEEALKNLNRSIKRLKRFYFFIYIYAVSMLLLNATTVLLGALGGVMYFVPTCIVSFFIITRLVYERHRLDLGTHSTPAAYPSIYKIVRNAAKKLNLRDEVRVMFVEGCNASVVSLDNTHSLQLGVELLDIVSEEEFEQVVLHELAHIRHNNSRMEAIHRLRQRIEREPRNDIMFYFPDTVFSYEFAIYHRTASVAIENIADSVVVECGNPKLAANALAKISCQTLFENEIYNFLPPLYSFETKPKNYSQIHSEAFKKALMQRGEAWKQILFNEIESNTATHPILKNRLKNIGVSEFVLSVPDDEGDFRDECISALKSVDRNIYYYELENYEKQRAEEYIDHLNIVEKWENDGCPLIPEQYRILLKAYIQIGKQKEAEKLCDRILENEKNPNALPFVHLTKGKLLLERYDNGGIQHIYDSMSNRYNIEEGLSIIGNYCCLMGLEKERDEYQEKFVFFSDNQLQENSHSGVLCKSDKIAKHDLSNEMLDEIVNYTVKSADGSIEKIYLVNKIISQSFVVSAFVIEFKQDANIEQKKDVMKNLYEHLDIHPSGKNFSLFVLDKENRKAIKKIKNSCVYSAGER